MMNAIPQYYISNPFTAKQFKKNDFIPTPNLEVKDMDINQSILSQETINSSIISAIDSSMIYKDLLTSLDVCIDPSQQITDEDNCTQCGIPLKLLDDTYICEECGVEKPASLDYNPDIYNMSVETNYNSSTSSSLSFGFSGKNSYGYQRALLTSCSNYKNTSFQIIKKEILNRINAYNGNRPPMNVQLACVELYYTIKENDKSYLDMINEGLDEHNKKKRLVFRSNGKWGLIASCLYYACIKEGLTRTPREISEIIGIDEKYQSIGDKRMHEFHELGIINIPINIKIMDDYICRYFMLLDIPITYKSFVVDLIDRADKKYLHINNESRTSTKCIGAIHVLCMRVPELRHITKDVIASECQISKATFVKYSNMLCANFKLLKKTFKKHKIPMPIAWRDDN